jgi:N-acetylglucosaminyl-diphospho-decaprenol L-rhamnosyltransferase
MTNVQPRLPVVVVSYNTRDLLRKCLYALARSMDVALDVIVVDNASPDGSADMVRAKFPSVRLLAQDVNLGFAAASNVALRELDFGDVPAGTLTTPEFALLLNPDTEVRPDAIFTLLGFVRAHPRAGLVGAQLIYPDGRFQHSAFRFPGLAQTGIDFFPLHHRLLNSRLNGRYPRQTTPFEIDHPLGACMLVRRETMQQVGLLDEGYYMYVEEIDWCRRIRRAGWQIWCEPRAIIVHHEGQSTRQFRQAMFVALWRSRLRYFRKYHSPLYVALIRAIIRAGLWSEACKLKRANVSGEERASRLSAFAEVCAL